MDFPNRELELLKPGGNKVQNATLELLAEKDYFSKLNRSLALTGKVSC